MNLTASPSVSQAATMALTCRSGSGEVYISARCRIVVRQPTRSDPHCNGHCRSRLRKDRNAHCTGCNAHHTDRRARRQNVGIPCGDAKAQHFACLGRSWGTGRKRAGCSLVYCNRPRVRALKWDMELPMTRLQIASLERLRRCGGSGDVPCAFWSMS
jgi:hypothetical protein